MTSSSSTIDDMTLHARIERVEQQNRKLKAYLTVLSVCFVSVALMGAKAGMGNGEFNEITAKVLTIVDDTGRARVRVGSNNQEGSGIVVFNDAGVRVVSMGVPADEMGSGILFSDRAGRPRIGVGMEDEVPGLAFVDEAGKRIIAMGGDARGYGLSVLDENEAERAGIGYKEGNTGVALYDRQGQYVRGMVQQQDGVHYFSYVNADGKEVVEQ